MRQRFEGQIPNRIVTIVSTFWEKNSKNSKFDYKLRAVARQTHLLFNVIVVAFDSTNPSRIKIQKSKEHQQCDISHTLHNVVYGDWRFRDYTAIYTYLARLYQFLAKAAHAIDMDRLHMHTYGIMLAYHRLCRNWIKCMCIFWKKCSLLPYFDLKHRPLSSATVNWCRWIRIRTIVAVTSHKTHHARKRAKFFEGAQNIYRRDRETMPS